VSKERDDDEVGYGRPPKGGQFKKGTSGNLRGRPKGGKNAATVLNDALNERVRITENGKEKTITKMEAVLKQMIHKAASGDPRHAALLLKRLKEIEEKPERLQKGDRPVQAAEDKIIVEEILARMRRAIEGDRDD
jgi:hypothetical protein